MAVDRDDNFDGLRITFGDRVRRLRTVLGMTQNEFGDSLSYSGAAVARWEKMNHDPQPAERIIQAVRGVYGHRAAAFLQGDDVA